MKRFTGENLKSFYYFLLKINFRPMRDKFFSRKPLDLPDRKTNGLQKNKKMDTWIRKKSD